MSKLEHHHPKLLAPPGYRFLKVGEEIPDFYLFAHERDTFWGVGMPIHVGKQRQSSWFYIVVPIQTAENLLRTIKAIRQLTTDPLAAQLAQDALTNYETKSIE